MSVFMVECPTCHKSGSGPEFIVRDWDGHTYKFACGHEHHLHPEKGGARTWIVPAPETPREEKE